LLPGADGVYHNRHGDTPSTGMGGIVPGDILHFGLQVAVFYQTRGILGKLNASDLILESWGKSPHLTTIRNCGFYRYPLRVMRWK
jgi:hypothetical protein